MPMPGRDTKACILQSTLENNAEFQLLSFPQF